MKTIWFLHDRAVPSRTRIFQHSSTSLTRNQAVLVQEYSRTVYSMTLKIALHARSTVAVLRALRTNMTGSVRKLAGSRAAETFEISSPCLLRNP
jgi:hypothetical protein